MAWEVWLAQVRFQESYEFKNRPVVIINESETFIGVFECTSQPPKNYGDFVLDWQRIGLKYKTVVKTYNLVYLQKEMFVHKIGDLGLTDIEKIMNYMKEYKYIKAYKTENFNRTENKKGCYIATTIYGSYDCPQVWVLRRYRDYSLSETWYGRGLIKLYYTVSPTIVKWFGKNKWFIRFFKKRLDKYVTKLKSNGYKDIPYRDSNDVATR